jgi:RING finger protein 113A
VQVPARPRHLCVHPLASPSLVPALILSTDLAGWQLDQLAADPKRAADADAGGTDSDSDADIPFACLICRKPYTDPVATRCGHYFCSACAIRRFARTPKCRACGTPTGGIFNRADKVIGKLHAKKQAQEEEEDGVPQAVEVEGLADD